ncbi:MAG: translocation/assembly module TamB domain-containing protein, partial [Flavobacterium sp.]|uniref:translocation/assembly module TamB domain-containing protein n=1 Tax=Flavobacterium sp. TaxID=239 RepID=UPI0022BC4E41
INERITFNGKAGVPVGGINQSAIVGNVEIQYRVNEDGTLNLKFFNRENDINYLGQNIGYTQGFGISYEVDFDTFQELLHKIFKNQKIEKEKQSEKEVPDSEVLPEFINFTDSSKKKKETTEQKKESAPQED